MAKKYIDAELLKKEINKHYDDYRAKFHQNGERYYLGLIDGIEMTKRIIDSLQQEPSCDTCTNDYWTTDQQLVPFKATEFIRKDTLMEWAKENRDSLGRLSYGEFVDKLNKI